MVYYFFICIIACSNMIYNSQVSQSSDVFPTVETEAKKRHHSRLEAIHASIRLANQKKALLANTEPLLQKKSLRPSAQPADSSENSPVNPHLIQPTALTRRFESLGLEIPTTSSPHKINTKDNIGSVNNEDDDKDSTLKRLISHAHNRLGANLQKSTDLDSSSILAFLHGNKNNSSLHESSIHKGLPTSQEQSTMTLDSTPSTTSSSFSSPETLLWVGIPLTAILSAGTTYLLLEYNKPARRGIADFSVGDAMGIGSIAKAAMVISVLGVASYWGTRFMNSLHSTCQAERDLLETK